MIAGVILMHFLQSLRMMERELNERKKKKTRRRKKKKVATREKSRKRKRINQMKLNYLQKRSYPKQNILHQRHSIKQRIVKWTSKISLLLKN
jgi:hypothetical protein